MALRTLLAVALGFASALPARAALVLEFIQVPSLTAALSNGPALTSLALVPGQTVFVQVALRDTTGSTVAWDPAPLFGLGLGGFLIQFDGIPGVAVNPGPTTSINARLVNPIDYGTVTTGSSPPSFTRIGGLLNFGSEPGALPDPTAQNRIGLFNLRVQSIGFGSGTFRLRDPNPSPGSADNLLLRPTDICCPNPGTVIPIDDLIFGPSFTNTYDLPVVVTPEPSGLVLCCLATVAAAWRARSSVSPERKRR